MSGKEFCISDLTTGQLNALVKKIGRDNVPGILDGTIEFTVTPKAQKFLKLNDSITLPERTDPFDPKEFFKTREGLYVWNDFTRRILPVTKEIESLPEMKITSFDLIEPAIDVQVQYELPESHVFKDADVFCACIVGLLEKQKNGEGGVLLNNGFANIFYVVGKDSEVFPVGVRWYSDFRRWDVRAYRLGDNQWRVGNRAFSATAEL